MKTINCIERRVVLDTTLCDKVCQLLAASWWFSPGTPVSSSNKTDRHDITEKPAGLDNPCMSTHSYVCVDIELNTLRKKTNVHLSSRRLILSMLTMTYKLAFLNYYIIVVTLAW